jgi:hypothetical protein
MLAYLRRGRDVATRQPDVRGPRDVAHPVGVSLQHILSTPRLRLLVETPYLNEVVAARASEALHVCCGARRGGRGRGRRGRREEGARTRRRGPGNCVAANRVRLEYVGAPLTIIYARVAGNMLMENMRKLVLDRAHF